MDAACPSSARLGRRSFLLRSAAGLGALAGLLPSAAASDPPAAARGLPGLPHLPAKAKRIIYLFQSGAPSQVDLFDYKPLLAKVAGQHLPDSVRKGQRITGMTSGQKTLPVAPAKWAFKQCGPSGMWLSEQLPHLHGIAGDLCFIRSLHTDAINHDPAITFFQTGSQLAGRPAIGSWLAYGLGSTNADLPAYVVLTSRGAGRPNDQPLYDRLWGSGFLPTVHQGVKFRNSGDPVLYLRDPAGIDRALRRDQLDDLAALNRARLDAVGDGEIATRIAQYEMAFRMQTSVPELTDLSKEPQSVFDLYGEEARRPGTYAYNCLLARRLAQRDVRFIQLFHMGWDHHENVVDQLPRQCREADRPTAALITDLKRTGLLKDTLVVWGGEFGRTVYSQGDLKPERYGRDHHPRAFTMWLAGAGIQAGTVLGETDDYGYNITADPVSVHDLHATVLHLLGVDHQRLTFKFQGRNYRLTDVHGTLVKRILT